MLASAINTGSVLLSQNTISGTAGPTSGVLVELSGAVSGVNVTVSGNSLHNVSSCSYGASLKTLLNIALLRFCWALQIYRGACVHTVLQILGVLLRCCFTRAW